MRRKMLITVLTCLFSMQLTVTQASDIKAEPLTDVQGHWAEQKINALQKAGVISGNEGNFMPNKSITMSELVVMILKASDIEPTKAAKSSFADVSLDSWMSPYMETAYRLGIIHGSVENGRRTLDATSPIKRQELIAIMNRAKGDSGKVNNVKWSDTYNTLKNYPDHQQVPTWSQREYVYAIKNWDLGEIIAGTGDQLDPTKSVTRAEAANFVYNLLYQPATEEQKQMKTGSVSFPYTKKINVKTTAYDFTNGPTKGYLGWDLREGIVAVDPAIIPLGTHLYIEGYGYAVAGDIGSAVKKNHIDLFMKSNKQSEAHGIKQANVYILD
ncbi:S-layer homology domain-containing protein [Brevibacillus daliensis]|uniref:S-layer homology domain-containing protein n=1 Tax=Brevibacillus daliensis TaxID=2892995 RepID=UPI001E508515|nr:S-layer homology domain-containing protein [Brevibacillus daliensis]